MPIGIGGRGNGISPISFFSDRACGNFILYRGHAADVVAGVTTSARLIAAETAFGGAAPMATA